METCRPEAKENPPPALAGDARVSVVGAPTRCPGCAQVVRPREETWTGCAACLTRHHASCWRARSSCAACGDATPLVPVRRARGAAGGETPVDLVSPAEPAPPRATPVVHGSAPEPPIGRAGAIALLAGPPAATAFIVLTIQLASGSPWPGPDVATGVAAALALVALFPLCAVAAFFVRAAADVELRLPEATPALGLWLADRDADEPRLPAGSPEETAHRLRDRIDAHRRERAGEAAP